MPSYKWKGENESRITYERQAAAADSTLDQPMYASPWMI